MKKIGLFAAGVLFGTAGMKLLGSKDAKRAYAQTTAAALRVGYRDAAERNLRSMLASRSIAEAENITVSTLEVNNEYRRLSQLQDTPEADIRRVLSPDTLAAALVAQKVQRFLLDNADITTVMDPEKE